MSKSTGQWIGAGIGAVVGFFVGYPMLGASIGSMIGGAIDPPKGPDIVGPKLDDLSVQTSTYGASLPRGYGTFPVVGNVFWLEGDALRPEEYEEDQGGGKGGGGGATYKGTRYYATFAVGLLKVPSSALTVNLRRRWIDTNLVFDGTGTNTTSTIASNVAGMSVQAALKQVDQMMSSASSGPSWSFYPGSDGQTPDPRMQADMGAGSTSAYPGVCYTVINDLNLTEHYSNTLLRAQIKDELTVGSSTNAITDLQRAVELEAVAGYIKHIIGVFGTSTSMTVWIWYSDNNYNSIALRSYTFTYGESYAASANIDISSVDFSSTLTGGSWNPNPNPLHLSYSDSPLFVGAQLSSFAISTRMWFIDSSGTASYSTEYAPSEWVGSSPHNGSFCYGGGQLFTSSFQSPGDKLRLWSAVGQWSSIVARSASAYTIYSMGLSTSYLMAVNFGAGGFGAQVLVFDRDDLTLVDTIYTGVGTFESFIQVISDTEFYLSDTDTHIYRYFSGSTFDLGANSSPRTDFGAMDYYYTLSQDTPQFGGFVYEYPGGSAKPNQWWIGMSSAVVSANVAKLRDIVAAECSLVGLDAGDLDLTALTNSDVRGFRIANPGAVRNNLEPLQAAWPFDVLQSGYKIKFVSRGGSSVATIPESDLGTAAAGDAVPILLPVSREMDSQLARRVNVKFMDPSREYDIGEQYAERPASATVSVNERTVELPLVLTNAEAAQIADVLLSKDWTERIEFGPFTLPPTWRALEPADVITVQHRGQSHTVRLTRVEYMPDGRLQCNARLTAAASYTSTATGADPLSIGQSLVPLRGSTRAWLLDIPRIRSEQDVFGMAWAMTGLASSWPGGVLLRSDDQGQSWAEIGSQMTRAKVFTAGAALSSDDCYAMDAKASLIVTPYYTGHTLSSVTEEQWYAQATLAAYGVDGRWEIVAFRDVVDNTGTYTLTGFLRGMFGTEQHTGTHVSGDWLIMLDTTTIEFFGLPSSAWGVERLYRSATYGATLDSAVSEADTYDAKALIPLSPVDLNGSRDNVTNDWTILWQRRTRWPVELLSGSTVPLGETAESYEIQVWDSGYAVLKRTLTSTTTSVSYPSAQQVTDFGSGQETLYLKIRQMSAVVGGGGWLQQSITRAYSADPYGYAVTSLCHFNGTNGSTTITDVKGNAWTCGGNAQLSTTTPIEGSASALFDGTTDYISGSGQSTPFQFTGDFTVECTYKPAAIGGTSQVIFDFHPNITNGYYLQLYVTAAGIAKIYSNSADRITGTTTIVSGSAYKFALCRVSGVTRLFMNGTQEGSGWSDSSTFNVGASRPLIGANGAAPYTMSVNGRIDEWRVTKGVGRYSAAYTPQVGEFPDP